MSEFAWIQTYFAPLASHDAALSLTDDGALLTIPDGQQLVITTDTLNEGIHFLSNSSPDLIAQKALRVNLSDLAAMGATPLGYTLNLSLPKDTTESFIASFCEGLREDQKTYSFTLLGGDTTATDGPLSVTITAYGVVKAGSALTRSGAQEGDTIYITGTIGDAVIGLNDGASYPQCQTRYELPQPRTDIGASLIDVATACMDISDGLVQDMKHLCRASELGAAIDTACISLCDEAKQWLTKEENDLRMLITGGDDYELLFTAPAAANDTIQILAQTHDIPITAIGTITSGHDMLFNDESGEAMTFRQKGYQHF